jgi:hypothetical protein
MRNHLLSFIYKSIQSTTVLSCEMFILSSGCVKIMGIGASGFTLCKCSTAVRIIYTCIVLSCRQVTLALKTDRKFKPATTGKR